MLRMVFLCAYLDITLFKSITILSVPHNIVMDVNNVMDF